MHRLAQTTTGQNPANLVVLLVVALLVVILIRFRSVQVAVVTGLVAGVAMLLLLRSPAVAMGQTASLNVAIVTAFLAALLTWP